MTEQGLRKTHQAAVHTEDVWRVGEAIQEAFGIIRVWDIEWLEQGGGQGRGTSEKEERVNMDLEVEANDWGDGRGSGQNRA